MLIVLPRKLRQLTRDEFGQLDYAVMSQAFACQNDLGRLCEEGAYQSDLASRLEAIGLGPALIEQPLAVEHGDFRKRYEIDLIVADAALYELKAVTALARKHEGQLLNLNFHSVELTTVEKMSRAGG